MAPRISVIMPVYNAAPYLGEALASLAAQRFREFELIAVDDGSTDESPQILAAFAAQNPNTRVLRQAHAGAGTARNHGMDAAQGEYWLFLDADDIFLPKMLERLYALATAQEADVTVCKSLEFWSEAPEVRTPIPYAIDDARLPKTQPFAGADCPDRLFLLFTGWPWDKLFRASAAVEGLRFSALPTSNDLSFVYVALARAARIAILPEALVVHRRGNPSSLENQRGKSYDACLHALLELKEGLGPDFPHFSRGFSRYARAFLRWNRKTLPSEARRALCAALKNGWAKRLGLRGLRRLIDN